MKESSKDTEEE